MKGFLDFLPGDSVLHKMHPLSKLIISFFICIAAFVSTNFFFLGSLIIINLLISALGEGKSKCGVFKRTLGILRGLCKISVFLFVIQLICIRQGNVVLHIVGSFGITDYAIINALLLVLRLLAATMPLAIMISVTALGDFSNILVGVFHIPYKYAFTLTSAIRFIPVFSIEMNGIIESQQARGVDFEIKNPFKKLGMILPLFFPLLISSVRKIESTATAAELRGFYLRTRNCCTKSYRIHFCDIVFVLIGGAILAGGIII